MRLDKYLKVSRLVKRRTLAREACDAGRVAVNGKPRKAGYDVEPGDRIEISFGEKTLSVEVASAEEPKAKTDVSGLYRSC